VYPGKKNQREAGIILSSFPEITRTGQVTADSSTLEASVKSRNHHGISNNTAPDP